MLLYYKSNASMSYEIYDVEDSNRLWVFVIVEHGIILLKYMFQALIPDAPDWVMEEMERIDFLEERKRG